MDESMPCVKIKLCEKTHPKLIEAVRHVKRAKKCVLITGAGISCSGGIPDFRSSDGLYNLIASKYPGTFSKGKDLFDANLLHSDTSRRGFYEFMGLLKEFILNAHPTATHLFMKKLHDVGKLVRVYTQNIDNLEECVGLNVKWMVNSKCAQVVQLHGTMQMVKCTYCTESFPFTEEYCEIYKQGGAPSCPACEAREETRRKQGKRRHAVGLLKPSILLYGDSHPLGIQIGQLAAKDEERLDCLIILGTSLRIPGVKSLIRRFSRAVHARNGKVILVNATDVAKKEWDGIIDYEVVGTSDEWVALVEKELEKKESTRMRKLNERRKEREMNGRKRKKEMLGVRSILNARRKKGINGDMKKGRYEALKLNSGNRKRFHTKPMRVRVQDDESEHACSSSSVYDSVDTVETDDLSDAKTIISEDDENKLEVRVNVEVMSRLTDTSSLSELSDVSDSELSDVESCSEMGRVIVEIEENRNIMYLSEKSCVKSCMKSRIERTSSNPIGSCMRSDEETDTKSSDEEVNRYNARGRKRKAIGLLKEQFKVVKKVTMVENEKRGIGGPRRSARLLLRRGK